MAHFRTEPVVSLLSFFYLNCNWSLSLSYPFGTGSTCHIQATGSLESVSLSLHLLKLKNILAILIIQLVKLSTEGSSVISYRHVYKAMC